MPHQFDPVYKPAHYNQYPIECIEICERLPYEAGCAIKYYWRLKHKDNESQDREKANWYILRELMSYPVYVPHELLTQKLRKLARVAEKIDDRSYSTIRDILLKLSGDKSAASRLASQLQADGFVDYPFADEFSEVEGGCNALSL